MSRIGNFPWISSLLFWEFKKFIHYIILFYITDIFRILLDSISFYSFIYKFRNLFLNYKLIRFNLKMWLNFLHNKNIFIIIYFCVSSFYVIFIIISHFQQINWKLFSKKCKLFRIYLHYYFVQISCSTMKNSKLK